MLPIHEINIQAGALNMLELCIARDFSDHGVLVVFLLVF